MSYLRRPDHDPDEPSAEEARDWLPVRALAVLVQRYQGVYRLGEPHVHRTRCVGGGAHVDVAGCGEAEMVDCLVGVVNETFRLRRRPRAPTWRQSPPIGTASTSACPVIAFVAKGEESWCAHLPAEKAQDYAEHLLSKRRTAFYQVQWVSGRGA